MLLPFASHLLRLVSVPRRQALAVALLASLSLPPALPAAEPVPAPPDGAPGPVSPGSLVPALATNPALPPDDTLTPETIAARRAALQKEIAATRADFAGLTENAPEETALWLTQEIGLLSRLDDLHAAQLRTLQHASDLAKESAEITALTQNPRPPDVRLPPPHGLPLLEQFYGQRDYLVQAEALLKTDVENATAALDDARDELEDKDRLRRTAKEAVGKTTDSAKARGALRLAELESRCARENVQLCEKALETLKLQQSLIAPRLALLLPDFDWLRKKLVVSEADLAALRARHEKRIAELDAALTTTRDEADRVARLVVAAERLVTDSTRTPEELESRRADRQTVNLMLGALASQRERQSTFAAVLDLRRRVLTRAADAAEMKAWAETNRDALERLPKDRRLRFAALRKARKELQDLQSRLADPDSPARLQIWVADRVKHLAAWIALNERDVADLAELAIARNRLGEELDPHVNTFDLGDTLASARSHLLAGWDYEVFSVGDRPIRVKTLLAVIALVFSGHWVSRRASDYIGRAVFRRLGMNTGSRAAWQTLSFYALFLIVLLVAFNLFHFSLTQFSVISGALAVGIGFGSQNLVGNFISGIILLLERPVNQGDVIEIDGQQMTVERLGPRSTIVRSYDNTHVIVPNSRLLEENVVNWTLSDDVVRTRINVGVAYGSPTREVAHLLEEVLLGLEDVRREPAPLVVFTDFGDSALIFQASFWSALEGRKEVESELRHRIAESFSRAGVVMAFPQRDVHLATTKPLQVEILAAPAPAKPARPAA